MRSTLAVLVLFGVSPLAAQNPDPLAFLRRGSEQEDMAFINYKAQPYSPIRPGEMRASGFLTESRSMPFGELLGPVDPPVIRATESAEAALPGMIIAVRPPEGAAYQKGDTVVLALVTPGPKGWGSIVTPTGLARVGDHTPRQTLATVISMFGPMRYGQVVFPLEPAANPGTVVPVAISGPSGEVLGSEEPRELLQPGNRIFANIGRAAGIRVGDFVQVRRRPTQRIHAADTIDDLMATGQVVHIGEKSCTVKLTRIVDPAIRRGATVVRVATLPG
ncbi:MAG: hypothetical protein ACREK8_11800 [Gemmatimonadales bacterium]